MEGVRYIFNFDFDPADKLGQMRVVQLDWTGKYYRGTFAVAPLTENCMNS